MSIARFNGVELTPETMHATREWFADNARRCIAAAVSGKNQVNDLGSYVAWRERCIADSLAGKGDRTLAFLQRAYFIQTGESVALLP